MTDTPPPRTFLFWFWVLCRVVCIVPVAVVGGTFLFVAGYGLLHAALGTALSWGAMSAGVLYCVWLASRFTWQVCAGTKTYAADKIKTELNSISAVFVLGFLMLLVVGPQFVSLFRYSAEGAMKGGLITLREGVERYRAAHDGKTPASIDELLASGATKEIPELWPRFSGSVHPHTRAALVALEGTSSDSGLWAFTVSLSSPGLTGKVFIDCTHTDARGRFWTEY